MKIVLGSDHGGFELKKELVKFLKEQGYETIDVGAYSSEPASWSEFGIKAAQKVANKEADFGVVICKSAQGVCMASNKVKGAYCGIAYNDDNAHLLKEHDGANMIALPASYVTIEDAKRRVMLFLNAKFEGGRHAVRFEHLKEFEKNQK